MTAAPGTERTGAPRRSLISDTGQTGPTMGLEVFRTEVAAPLHLPSLQRYPPAGAGAGKAKEARHGSSS